MISPRSEGGFGLVQVLILLAVVSVSASLYFQTRGLSLRAAKSLDSSKSVLDLNTALTAELTALVRAINPAAPGCLDLGAEAHNRALTKAFGTSKLNVTQAVAHDQWLPPSMQASERSRLLAAIQESPILRPALQRCRQQRLPANATNSAANTFYFCLNVSQDADAAAGSFLQAPFAFVEVGWNLVNLHSGAPISCQDFASMGDAAGAQLFYSIHWATPLGQDHTFKKYTNTVTVGR